MHLIFKLVSILLRYPTAELKASLPEIRQAVSELPFLKSYESEMESVLSYLEETELLELQMNYVNAFDLNRSQALYLFEHVHGEDRDRGGAMVDLVQEYEKHGLVIGANELPDFLPLVLEFLSEVDSEVANVILSDAVSVINHLGIKLKSTDNPYAPLFDVIVDISPSEPKPLIEPPVRDMDEAMEMFGSSYDGVEPLLTPGLPSACHISGEQPIKFVGV